MDEHIRWLFEVIHRLGANVNLVPQPAAGPGDIRFVRWEKRMTVFDPAAGTGDRPFPDRV